MFKSGYKRSSIKLVYARWGFLFSTIDKSIKKSLCCLFHYQSKNSQFPHDFFSFKFRDDKTLISEFIYQSLGALRNLETLDLDM